MSTAGAQVDGVIPSSARERESVCSNRWFIRSWMDKRSRNGSHFTTAICVPLSGGVRRRDPGPAGRVAAASLLALAEVFELRVHDVALGRRPTLLLRCFPVFRPARCLLFAGLIVHHIGQIGSANVCTPV